MAKRRAKAASNEPDYSSPLGISKDEWRKVLSANLAVVLAAYAIACAFTLSGSDFFLLNYENADFANFEATLRGWGIYPIVQTLFKCVELCIIARFVCGSKLGRWFAPSYVLADMAMNLALTPSNGYTATASRCIEAVFISLAMMISKEDFGGKLRRLPIAAAVSLALNGAIAVFRGVSGGVSAPSALALCAEYDLSLAMALARISLGRKGGERGCRIRRIASGSSPTSMKSRTRPSRIANESGLPPRAAKRLRRMKARAMALQTLALVLTSAAPWAFGRQAEFALAFCSFCFVRLCLGFRHSLHLKSGLACVCAGSAVFLCLCALCPSVGASVILSSAYGASLAIGFRLYWELRDLIWYRRASKNDRYAMAQCALRGNCSPKRVRAVLAKNGFGGDDAAMFQEYISGVKVSAIAADFNYSKVWVEQKLTSISDAIYANR